MDGWRNLNHLNDALVALIARDSFGFMNINATIHRAGAIPFRRPKKKSDPVSILLITSMTRRRWIVPKGTLEFGESMEEAAVRETLEETGVKGRLMTEFPMTVMIERQFEAFYEHVPCTFFPLLAKSTSKKWLEENVRERQWVTLPQARRLIKDDDYSELLTQFEALLPAVLQRL
ncbi:MAG: NUDIX hydrolase [Pseudomonadota bacterium]